MFKRLLSLVIALTVAGAPIAFEVCQVACTAHAQPRHATAAESGPACHHAADRSQHASPQAPPCGQDGDSTILSVVAARHPEIVPLAVSPLPAADRALIDDGHGRLSSGSVVLPHRVELRLAVPLRI